jgi:hypothetical protein
MVNSRSSLFVFSIFALTFPPRRKNEMWQMKTAKLDGKNGFNDQRIYREKLIQPLWLFCTDARLCNRLH